MLECIRFIHSFSDRAFRLDTNSCFLEEEEEKKIYGFSLCGTHTIPGFFSRVINAELKQKDEPSET